VAEAVRLGRELNVRKYYVELVERAFEQIGSIAGINEYRRTTPAPPYRIEDLSVEIDPTIAPVRAASLAASYLQGPTPDAGHSRNP